MMHTLLKQTHIVEKLMAECISRMYGFLQLAEEQERIENDVLDSDLELTSAEARVLVTISNYMSNYAVAFGGRSSQDAEQATLNMVICDRELPEAVVCILAETMIGLVRKNHLILIAEPNSPVHSYVEGHEKAYHSENSLDPAYLSNVLSINPFASSGHSRSQMFSQYRPTETVS